MQINSYHSHEPLVLAVAPPGTASPLRSGCLTPPLRPFSRPRDAQCPAAPLSPGSQQLVWSGQFPKLATPPFTFGRHKGHVRAARHVPFGAPIGIACAPSRPGPGRHLSTWLTHLDGAGRRRPASSVGRYGTGLVVLKGLIESGAALVCGGHSVRPMRRDNRFLRCAACYGPPLPVRRARRQGS